ncbi:MAG: glycosyltransferase family 2 protein, partial [Dissulfurispiraceae bacterium]
MTFWFWLIGVAAEMPEISVLMSCYNASKYLAEAIESILNQTFDNFEFIAIDDGSRDNTSDILKDYARADSRIILLEKENTGLTNSLNIGLKTARGKWIARMDADDVSLPNRFEDQLEFVQVHAGVILLGTSCIVIDQSGKVIRRYEYTAVHHQLIKKI